MENLQRKIVDCIVEHLRRDTDHLAALATGAAFEQWINSEMFAAINRNRNKLGLVDKWVENERGGVDLVITDKDKNIHAAIETKLLSPNDYDQQSRCIVDQLQKRRRENKRAEFVLGLVFARWTDWCCWSMSEEDFLRSCIEAMRQASSISRQHIELGDQVVIVPRQRTEWPGFTREVSLKLMPLSEKAPLVFQENARGVV